MILIVFRFLIVWVVRFLDLYYPMKLQWHISTDFVSGVSDFAVQRVDPGASLISHHLSHSVISVPTEIPQQVRMNPV